MNHQLLPQRPEMLREPAPDARRATAIGGYLTWLERTRDLAFTGYHDLHRWSVADLEGFWSSIWDYFDVRARTPYDRVLGRRDMPGAEWFPGATLNYAEHVLRPAGAAPSGMAVLARSQTRGPLELSWGDLADQVARARAGLRALGVGRGDRVVAYLPNIPETLVAFLATASLGAIWSSCAPEFGARGVIDRFSQIEPTVLLAIAGYRYGEKDIDRRDEVAAIRTGLPTLRHTVHVPYGPGDLADTVAWADLLTGPAEPGFDAVPFAHPLCVLFSSGTTGKPKAIIHGHGGILLEHLKNHSLSWDLGPGDRMLWFTTTAWMMWNSLVSGLLVGASIVMIDGNPLHPGLDWQWRLAEETGATLMGASPGFLMACRKEGLIPAKDHDLSRLRQIGAAGSPLPAEGFRWVHEQFGPGVLLNVGSGGTDVCTGILQGNPLRPVWAGEISGPCLGVAATAYDERGNEVTDVLGELVITQPMPSMPIGFWGDTDGSRYRDAYFDTYPGVWRHGDWVRFTAATGSCTVAGRSDATLNRGGVRLGTAEFYRIVEELPEIDDSLVVHLDDTTGGPGRLLLFVALHDGVELDDALRRRITTALRDALSPRHVPDGITAMPVIPRNRTGKKLELPVKKILLGAAPSEVVSPDTLAEPTSLAAFAALASRRSAH
ncbi:acetoacetate--CoA ligase [Nonomuraea basaltis]|uniref:acetoacetate--CoA ligase n=1 Tax=Nonomuraea basaltis TaxID=2495887 RepID=UPI001F0EEF94|nr:acetoacetate--CoA ligase [Nonomuraea basaltis]